MALVGSSGVGKSTLINNLAQANQATAAIRARERQAEGEEREDRGDGVQPVVKWLGRVDYEPTWRAMQHFTDERGPDTPDEIWLLEHPPVYTLGLNTDPAHLLGTGTIPVIQTDRGGQVTYHGPGQLVVYVLVDLKRRKLGVRELVRRLEAAVVEWLKVVEP